MQPSPEPALSSAEFREVPLSAPLVEVRLLAHAVNGDGRPRDHDRDRRPARQTRIRRFGRQALPG